MTSKKYPIRDRRYLIRKYEKFKPNFIVRIVTEGEKTEPIYFRSLIRKFRITTTKVIVTPSEYGSDPLSVVNFALDVRKKNKRDNRLSGEPKYDYIFCVFDKDDHINYYDAFRKGIDNDINIIRSIPCFEIWLLLHYHYSTKPYDNREELYRELKKHIPGYEKGMDALEYIWENHIDAMSNAEMLYREQGKLHDLKRDHPNPMTEIHQIIDIITQR